MNKMVVTTLESKFRCYDLRTEHPTDGYSYMTEKAHANRPPLSLSRPSTKRHPEYPHIHARVIKLGRVDTLQRARARAPDRHASPARARRADTSPRYGACVTSRRTATCS